MIKNNIIQLALKSGFAYEPKTGHIVATGGYTEVIVTAGLERFHALAVAAEREACIELCEDISADGGMYHASAIRARNIT
jgi:hypothetical protein